MRVWKKSGKGQAFKGTYEFQRVRYTGARERVFILIGLKTGRRITFESWQMAKAMKWELK